MKHSKQLMELRDRIAKLRKERPSPLKSTFILKTAYDFYERDTTGYSAQEHDDKLEILSEDFGRLSFN